MNSTHLLITLRTRPEATSDFATLLQRVKHDLPQVSGCRGVRVFADHDDPCVFTLLEEWESIARHQAHIEHMVASGEWARIRAHLAADPVSRYLTER